MPAIVLTDEEHQRRAALTHLTLEEAAAEIGIAVCTLREYANRHALKFTKAREPDLRGQFPEKSSPVARQLRANDIPEGEVMRAALEEAGHRAGAIDKAIRMHEVGHPPQVIADYCGMTRGEVVTALEREW